MKDGIQKIVHDQHPDGLTKLIDTWIIYFNEVSGIRVLLKDGVYTLSPYNFRGDDSVFIFDVTMRGETDYLTSAYNWLLALTDVELYDILQSDLNQQK